jgi:hypothetical protein
MTLIELVIAGCAADVVAADGQKYRLFQIVRGIDKIARRGANRGNKRLFGLTYH